MFNDKRIDLYMEAIGKGIYKITDICDLRVRRQVIGIIISSINDGSATESFKNQLINYYVYMINNKKFDINSVDECVLKDVKNTLNI